MAIRAPGRKDTGGCRWTDSDRRGCQFPTRKLPRSLLSPTTQLCYGPVKGGCWSTHALCAALLPPARLSHLPSCLPGNLRCSPRCPKRRQQAYDNYVATVIICESLYDLA